MNGRVATAAPAWALAWLLTAGLTGCRNGQFDLNAPWVAPPPPENAQVQVPEPIHLLLPRSIRIHPFTGTRSFDEGGGVRGIDVRIEALDAYGDATKAFGKFHFALYQHRAGRPDPKGARIETWEEDLLSPEKNRTHWDRITRAYQFKLRWFRPVPVGGKFVLVVTFSSPFGERKFAERTFVSGQ